MIIWMLWSLLFTMLIALAALAAERVAAHYAWPRRVIWMAAIIVCAVVPTVLAVRPARVIPVQRTSGPSTSVDAVPALEPAAPPPSPITQSVERAAVAQADMDAWAVRIWLLLSLGVLGTFAKAAWALRRQRAGWRDTDLTLCRALVATDVGPAVVGFLRPRVVVPQWALTVDEPTRHMILRHEMEHLRARDPQALLGAGLLLIAFPWNLPLWWIVSRLRLAMELDCDARVVRDGGMSYEYGRVLLAVGERHTLSLPLAASLTGRQPLLARRINAMMMKKPRRPLVASLPFAALAFVAITAATRAPHPAPLRGISAARVQQPYPTRDAIAAMLRANVPALSTAGDSSNYAVLVLDANNNFVTATAGYGNLMVQVWGDPLDPAERAARTVERGGSPDAIGGAVYGRMSIQGRGAARGAGAGAGGAARGAGGGGSARGAGARGGAASGSGAGARGGGGDSLAGWLRRSTELAAYTYSFWGTGYAASPGVTTNWSLRGPGNEPLSLGGPANGYTAGFALQRLVDAGSPSATPLNAAPGLHSLTGGGSDDSAIDGIRASNLTSLETYRFGSDVFADHNVSVIVVTTNTIGRLK